MDHIEIMGSAVAGAGISTALAKAFISKSLRDLDSALKRIAEIDTHLAATNARLLGLDRAYDLLHKLDRKIIALEIKVYGSAHHDT